MKPNTIRLLLVGAALAFVICIFFWKFKKPALSPQVVPVVVRPLDVKDPRPTAVLPSGSGEIHPSIDLRKAIDAGASRLEQRPLDQTKCHANPIIVKKKIRVCSPATTRRGRTSYQKCRIVVQKVSQAVVGLKRCVGDYLLAVAAPNGKVAIVEAYERRESFPSGYRVDVEDNGKRRGVNVPFKVTAPPGRTVVGLKTAILTKNGGAENAVYVPYSSTLDVPELREQGLRYLERIALTALAELKGQKIPSKFHGGKLVAETVEIQHLVTLILTEQMKDAGLFVRGTDEDRLAMTNRTLTILGANMEDSYSYTRSRVGAAGIAQVMPSTYARLRRTYPKAKLPVGRDALVDHGVAMKAMILHADAQWWPLVGDLNYRTWLLAHPEARRLMLAAGYNASAGTVVNAFKKCGTTWREESCRALPLETRWYLIKYETVWSLLYPVQPQQTSPLVANQ